MKWNVAVDAVRKYPISPRPENDARFSIGLLSDIRQVLERHGYPVVDVAGDLLDLQQALFRFLYGGGR